MGLTLRFAPSGRVQHATIERFQASGRAALSAAERMCILVAAHAIRVPPFADPAGLEILTPYAFTGAQLQDEREPEEVEGAPRRAEIVAAMLPVLPLVGACGAGAHGVATVEITWASDRRVQSARADRARLGERLADCIEAAVRNARVAPFARSEITVSYDVRY